MVELRLSLSTVKRTLGSGSVVRPYIRHGTGGNYSWVDGHVSMTMWKVMSAGAIGKIDWYYMTSPNDPGG